MRICKYRSEDGKEAIGAIAEDGSIRPVENADRIDRALRLTAGELVLGEPVAEAELLAPVDRQEIWAAGVTYRRSQIARREESEGAARFYDLVYEAERPELFFKATARRVVAPEQPVAIRSDTTWSVPEPELAIWLDVGLNLLGVGLGNDMSARDIEGENPLYLPQAKVYTRSCSVGPAVLRCDSFGQVGSVEISMVIRREGEIAFEGSTSSEQLNRPLEELVRWLGRDNDFPDGVVLLTGTGIVPPDEFTLQAGDLIEISGSGLGELANPVTVSGG